ncbi:MAG: hypothetical protein WBO09_06050 [Methylocystis silviterrae]|uniref:hypothetical protein n=1 Tax=Methylocystis silviterrae TaxID=2743612 RepID=UPI003C7290A3
MRIAFFLFALILTSTASADPATTLDGQHESTAGNVPPVAPESSPANADGAESSPPLTPVAPETIEQLPVLKHIAKSGAKLFDAGRGHDMRAVVARQGGEFMIFQVTPDGEAVIAGAQTDFSAATLHAIADGAQQITDLGVSHGVRGLFVRNGAQFQVFYATPDGERMIPGVMWDSTGTNITREQVAPLPGVTPTVIIGKEKEPGASAVAADGLKRSPLELAEHTNFGVIGAASAPRLFVFIDPLCSYSVKALQQLQPFLASGRVQAAIIPVSVLDYEDQGRSTTSALAMLSKPADQMAPAWSRGDLNGPPSGEAEAKLRANMTSADAIGLRGTPTVIWRKADGKEGRIDGLPEDWNAVIASMGGENHAAR